MEEQKICTNCKRNVPVSNMTIHVVHCMRNIVICSVCKDTIQKEGYAEHIKNHNKLVKCPDCKNEYKQSELEIHQQKCVEKMKQCDYCELELRMTEMGEHLLYCGSRTERCVECNELVMFKYQKLHLESNHTFLKLDDEPGPVASWLQNSASSHEENSIRNDLNDRRNFEMNYLYQDKIGAQNKSHREADEERNIYKKDDFKNSSNDKNCMPYSNIKPVGSKNLSQRNLQSTFLPNNPVDAFRGLSQLQDVLPRRLVHAEADSVDGRRALGAVQRPAHSHKHKRRAPPPPNSPSQRPQSLNIGVNSMSKLNNTSISLESDDPEDVKLPCEHCNAMVPASKLVAHETICREKDMRNLGRPLRFHGPLSTHSKEFNSADNATVVEKHREDELPCEFCLGLYPASRLLDHQQICEVNY